MIERFPFINARRLAAVSTASMFMVTGCVIVTEKPGAAEPAPVVTSPAQQPPAPSAPSPARPSSTENSTGSPTGNYPSSLTPTARNTNPPATLVYEPFDENSGYFSRKVAFRDQSFEMTLRCNDASPVMVLGRYSAGRLIEATPTTTFDADQMGLSLSPCEDGKVKPEVQNSPTRYGEPLLTSLRLDLKPIR